MAYWYIALEPEHPLLSPQDFGWKADDINKSPSPTTVVKFVCVAPDHILKLIRCDTGKCWCTGSQIPCTIFCTCWGEPPCLNRFTSTEMINDNNEEEDIEEDAV